LLERKHDRLQSPIHELAPDWRWQLRRRISLAPRPAGRIANDAAWLHALATATLILGLACAFVIAADVVRNPQHMRIMNVVWPVTALFGTIWVLWQYFSYGRLAADAKARAAMECGEEMPSRKATPFPIMVANGTLHCGSGCTLGDLAGEWLAFFVPAVAVWLGYGSLFGERIFAVWMLDFIFAFAFGILFQYFTIAPMRNLSLRQGLIAALKADTLSITAWQIGMYGFMAAAYFYLFRHILGVELKVNSVEFWFMMQIAMLFGFMTSYPANWWLLRAGVKEKM
jgi:hypothetical protein